MTSRSRRVQLLTVGTAACLILTACSTSNTRAPESDATTPTPATTSGPSAGLRADSEIVLPNLDDDAGRCASVKGPDVAQCNDASDEIVNGDEDSADLTQLHLSAQSVSDRAVGKVSVTTGAGKVRVFVREGTNWSALGRGSTLSAAQLRAGLTLGVEGRDFVRDPAKWDGRVRVQVTVNDGTTQSGSEVGLRIAPMLSTNHTMALQQVLITEPDDSAKTRTFAKNLAAAAAGASVPGGVRQMRGSYAAFPQDMMEQFYFARPASSAGQAHSLSVYGVSEQRSDIIKTAQSLRGPGIGVIALGAGKDGSGFSFGNFETLPPNADDPDSHPYGQVLIGMDQVRHGSQSGHLHIRDLIAAQSQQEVIELDISHLAVGHVDEVFQVLPADTPRGWKLAVADPEAGLEVLRRAQQAGAGAERIKPRFLRVKGDTVDTALDPNKSDIVKVNERAAAILAQNIQRIATATGLTEDEIVRVPSLLRGTREYDGKVRLVPFLPAALNSLLLAPDRVLSAHQFSVTIEGRDIFEEAIEKAYASAGVSVTWIDDYETLAVMSGDVHCGTNSLRLVPGARPL